MAPGISGSAVTMRRRANISIAWSPGNSHQHSPAGMHLDAEGCALHGDPGYLSAA